MYLITLLALLIAVQCNDDSKKTTKNKSEVKTAVSIPQPIYLTNELEKMQGTWKSEDGTVIKVVKDRYTETSADGTTTTATIEAYGNCPNLCAKKGQNISKYECFILKSENTAMCFAILKLNDKEIQFTPMAGKAQLRNFRKN